MPPRTCAWACGVREPPLRRRRPALRYHNEPAAGALWYAPGRRDPSWGEGEDFDGIIDLVRMKAVIATAPKPLSRRFPRSIVPQAGDTDHLCELVAEADDELMMKYLEGETLTQEELEGLLSEGDRRAHL